MLYSMRLLPLRCRARCWGSGCPSPCSSLLALSTLVCLNWIEPGTCSNSLFFQLNSSLHDGILLLSCQHVHHPHGNGPRGQSLNLRLPPQQPAARYGVLSCWKMKLKFRGLIPPNSQIGNTWAGVILMAVMYSACYGSLGKKMFAAKA